MQTLWKGKGRWKMKRYILSLLLVTALTCRGVETETPNERFLHINRMLRCENDEVVCYLYLDNIGDAGRGGMSCKFKDKSADAGKKVGGK